MNNSRLKKDAGDSVDIIDGIISDLIIEIEELESKCETYETQIDNLKKTIDQLHEQIEELKKLRDE